ncbi:Stage III sporulation protein AD [Ruminococcaceae bacterium BL-4]|nr:Stage III sporulation protein AD [Ruminococcaceae bacterium BL-4]
MTLFGILGIALLSLAIILLLRRQNAEQALALGIAAGVLITLQILKNVLPAISELMSLFQSAGIKAEFGAILIKTLGVSFLTQFAADACRDSGESSLAAKVELAGRVEILIFALPLFQQIAAIAASLITSG